MKGYIKNNTKYKLRIRDGSYVYIEDIQKEILGIMDEVDKICRKYNITYGLIAGSALGMVNYKGFIPWDDDIDVFIKRDDWDKFVKALDKELSDKYYFHTFTKDNKYNVLIPQMKIRKKGTYVEEENILLDNKCDGNGVFVDVVMYGEVNKNKFVDELFRTIVKLLAIPLVIFDNLGFNLVILKKFIIRIDGFYNKISLGSGIYSQPITIPWEKFMHEPVFREEDVFPVREYEFEGRKYYSYNNIEGILKSWYGDICLKKWNKDKKMYEETLDKSKRVSKHIIDVNFESDLPKDKKYKLFLIMFVRFIFMLFILGIVLCILDIVFWGRVCIIIFMVGLYIVVR